MAGRNGGFKADIDNTSASEPGVAQDKDSSSSNDGQPD
jgi:hypothetical protein